MGIEQLSESLIAEAKKEAGEIIKAAEWHLEKMLNEERAKRAIIIKNAEEEAKQLIQEQHAERIAWAKLEAKRVISEAKEEALKNAEEKLIEELQNIRKKQEYKIFLKRLYAYGSAQLKGKDVVLHISKEDKSLVKSLFPGARVIEDLNSICGIIMETSDKRFRINLSVESIFRSMEDEWRKIINEKFFEPANAAKFPLKNKKED